MSDKLLIRHKKRVLLKSYSLWCVYLAAFFEGLPTAVPYLDNFIPSWLSFALLVLSPILRLINQDLAKTGDQHGDDADET